MHQLAARLAPRCPGAAQYWRRSRVATKSVPSSAVCHKLRPGMRSLFAPSQPAVSIFASNTGRHLKCRLQVRIVSRKHEYLVLAGAGELYEIDRKQNVDALLPSGLVGPVLRVAQGAVVHLNEGIAGPPRALRLRCCIALWFADVARGTAVHQNLGQ